MSDYEVLDEYITHEGCVRIPFPTMGWGWSLIFYDPSDRSFFFDMYSTGYICDDELRYHGTETLTLEEIIRLYSEDWPNKDAGRRVLNGILSRDFPGTPLFDVPEEEPPRNAPEKTARADDIHRKIWSLSDSGS